MAPILKFPDLLALVYELSHHFKIFCLKKGAGGELVSGGREKRFTFHFCVFSDQIREKFRGGHSFLCHKVWYGTVGTGVGTILSKGGGTPRFLGFFEKSSDLGF